MRLNARDIGFQVGAVPESLRPIRLKAGGLTYGLSTSEALELANQLADAVGEVSNHERNAS